MTRVIAFANHKGGVGKTTSVASIGSILARRSKRTLLVDLDAQANLTASLFRLGTSQNIYKAFKGEDLAFYELSENLHIVPSTLDMAGVELDISSRMSREYILRKLLSPIVSQFDYILLDCPPSLGLVTINALVAANELIIPMVAETLPSSGLAKLTNILQMVRENLNEHISLTGIIITRWENTNLSRMVEKNLRDMFEETVYTTKIRKNIAIAEAPLCTMDIEAYAPNSKGAQDYIALTKEIVMSNKVVK